METKCVGGIGSIWGKQYHQQNRVYSIGDIALCHPANIPGGSYNYLEIRKVDTMYGQNTIVEQSRAEQSRAEQSRAEQSRAEQLDCCVRLGNAYNDEKFNGGNFGGNVWDTNGLAPTMKTGASASQQCVVEVREMGKQGTFGASGVVNVKKLSGSGFEEKEVKINIDERFNGFLYEIDGEIYLIRIRKLTPKECWLLMNFSQEDFTKAESVNSNTQLYKEAGNSIVRNCLVAIFGQMFEGKEEVYKQV